MKFEDTYRRRVLALLVLIVTVAFLAMMRRFLLTLMLAAIFSALLHPVYRRLLRAFHGRKTIASAVTLLLVVLVVGIPLGAFVGVLVNQAIGVTESVSPWIQSHMGSRDQIVELMNRLPFGERLLPYRDEVLARAAELVKATGSFVVGKLSDLTRGTVNLIFRTVLMLYAMFFFLSDGARMLSSITRHLPLSPAETERIAGKFVSVARATLTSSVVIGAIQGTLGGIGFAVAGIPGAVFWGTMMTVLSMIPGVGTALIWVPGFLFLLASGRTIPAVAMAIYFILIVGTVDNLLRPRLVGKGAQMSELLVLLSTIGGITMFGIAGFIVGPILATLFIALWDIYGASVGTPSAPGDPPAAPE